MTARALPQTDVTTSAEIGCVSITLPPPVVVPDLWSLVLFCTLAVATVALQARILFRLRRTEDVARLLLAARDNDDGGWDGGGDDPEPLIEPVPTTPLSVVGGGRAA